MNLDRFEFGKKDIQDVAPWGYCSVTGDEIYEGDSYLESPEGEILKDDLEFLMEKENYVRKYAGEENV